MLSLIEALERFEVGVKITVFLYFFYKRFSFWENIIFNRFFPYKTKPVGFIWIWTKIRSFLLCKITQLEEIEMKLTGWTLS